MKKNNVDILLVPRISVQDILTKMREEAARFSEEKQLIARQDEVLKKYTNPRMFYPNNSRPPKKPLPLDLFKQFSNLPSNKRIILTSTGLLQITFRYDEIEKPVGTLLPIQIQPFTKNGNIT